MPNLYFDDRIISMSSIKLAESAEEFQQSPQKWIWWVWHWNEHEYDYEYDYDHEEHEQEEYGHGHGRGHGEEILKKLK